MAIDLFEAAELRAVSISVDGIRRENGASV